jgi:hypothetical protein
MTPSASVSKQIEEPAMAEDDVFVSYKPTPTQAEADAAAMGEHVMEKESDGSPEMEQPAPVVPPEPAPPEPPPEGSIDYQRRKKTVEAKPASDTYQTRTMRAAEPAVPVAPPPPKEE